MTAQSVRALNDAAHQHGVYVSTGGWVEHVLGQVGGGGALRSGG